jgi:hypothetical protein
LLADATIHFAVKYCGDGSVYGGVLRFFVASGFRAFAAESRQWRTDGHFWSIGLMGGRLLAMEFCGAVRWR